MEFLLIPLFLLILIVLSWRPLQSFFRIIVLVANAVPGRISSVVNTLTPEVTVEDAAYTSSDGLKLPMRIWHPPSSGRTPAVILYQGASPSGENHKVINRLAQGLAKVGFSVFIPRLPRLKEVLIREETVERMIEVFQQVRKRHDIQADKITVIGFSFGGSLLVKACLDPRMNGLPAKVLSYGSYFDLEKTLEFVLTGEYSFDGRDYSLEPHEWGSIVFFHNYLEKLNGDFNFETIHSYFLALVEEDERTAKKYAALSRKDKVFIDLISDNRKESLRQARKILPKLKSTIESISPRYFVESINFPLYLVHGADDNMIPFTETVTFSEALKEQAKEVHTFISRIYSHSEVESGKRGFADYIQEVLRLSRFMNDFLFR